MPAQKVGEPQMAQASPRPAREPPSPHHDLCLPKEGLGLRPDPTSEALPASVVEENGKSEPVSYAGGCAHSVLPNIEAWGSITDAQGLTSRQDLRELYALRDVFSSSRGSGYKSSTRRLRLSFRAQGLHDMLHGYLHSRREQSLS